LKTSTQQPIEIVERGIKFIVFTSNRIEKEPIHIDFCHKDKDGKFQNGITSEGLLLVLISRHKHLVYKDNCTENIRTLLFLQQAYEAIKSRKDNKRQLKDDYKKNDIPVSSGGE